MGTPPVDFRTATFADADTIARIHTRNWQIGYRGAFPDPFLDNELAHHHAREWHDKFTAPLPNQFIECAVERDRIIGFSCCYGGYDAEWGSFIDCLHVDPAAQGRHVGAALMRRASSWFAERWGRLPVYLFVLESNVAAKRFYQRIGARDAGVIEEVLHGVTVFSNRYVWDRPSEIGS
jgi:ribosomal protein S18 acetylase RimI-like enzyme